MQAEPNNDASGGLCSPLKKRVILCMRGKGGVGKVSLMAALTEWFDASQVPLKLLDLDSEN
jgi:hypothetical protein